MSQHPMLRAATNAKRRLLASEQQVARHIVDAYAGARARLAPHISRFTDAYGAELARLRAEHEDAMARVPLTWLHTSGQLARLQSAVRGELAGFASHVVMFVTHGQVDATQQAQADAHAALHDALPPVARFHLAFHQPNPDALTALIGRSTHDGAHLSHLLDTLAPDLARALEKTLFLALSLGRNPRVVARDLSDLLDSGGRARALTICRTEMLGAYRDATSATYRANSDVLDGWTWLADLSPRTCGLCIALNGTHHTLDEDMVSHANCRCTQVPITKSWQDILGPLGIDTSDIPETTAQVPSGSDWFDQQDAGTQQAILGKAGYGAYQAGDLSLSDLVGQDRDGGYYLKSLKQVGLDASDYLG